MQGSPLRPTVAVELARQAGAIDANPALAERLRARMARKFLRQMFSEVDLLLTPTLPKPAPPLIDIIRAAVEETIHRRGRISRVTRLFNGLGLLVFSVAPHGLSFALQIVVRPFDETTMLRLGRAWEQAAGGRGRRPGR